MAKPDWGELQQRFLSEHAATGVSPKEWCEAQGLNYATARRYIKKTSAQTAQKSAQKKVRIAQKEQSANELMDDDGLTAQQRLFVAEYLPWHIVSWPEGDLRTIQPRGELPLLERPFVLGHFDCWGLVMSYYRQTYGIELHDYRVDYPWWENDYPDNFYQDCWYECGFREFDGPPKPSDMVIMQVQADKWNHAGILLEGNMLLHHLYGHLSQRVPYGGYWMERTMKILRHKILLGCG